MFPWDKDEEEDDGWQPQEWGDVEEQCGPEYFLNKEQDILFRKKDEDCIRKSIQEAVKKLLEEL